MPIEVVHSYAIIKKAAAITNHSCGILSKDKMELISTVCDEIADGKHNDQFPLVVWQTGSGTQTNMNVNEVISNRCQQLLERDLNDEKYVKANDDVNKSQSSNDTSPTAMHMATYETIIEKTLPSIKQLHATLTQKSSEFMSVTKTGRTHLMDATPLTLGQEFSGYAMQLQRGMEAVSDSLHRIRELALGGTAVGTGLNTPRGYAVAVAEKISELTGNPFVSAENKFEALSAHAVSYTHLTLPTKRIV